MGGWLNSRSYSTKLTLHISSLLLLIVSSTGWKTIVVPLGERGYLGFARTCRRNTSTCADRRGQVSAKRDTAMPSAKPCCMLPVKTQTVRAS